MAEQELLIERIRKILIDGGIVISALLLLGGDFLR